MATGLPIVSTPVGGIPTLVDDGTDGFLVAPADINGLVEALKRILTDRGLANRMGAAGRHKAVHSLTWSSRAAMTDKLLRDVL